MVLELCHCVHPDAGIEWWLGGWFSSMRFRDFTAMGPCVVWTMRSNVERSGGKFVIGNQLHDFFMIFSGWWKIYLTYLTHFCFLGSDDWIKSSSVVAAWSKKIQKHDAQRRNSWKWCFFHLQADETYETYTFNANWKCSESIAVFGTDFFVSLVAKKKDPLTPLTSLSKASVFSFF